MFKPMLAKDADLAKISFPLVVQPKLDGIRASVVNGRLLTRTLKEVPNREIFEALSQPQFEGLDGELIVGSPTAPDCYRKTASFAMSASKTGEDWAFHVFDRWNEPGGFWTRYVKSMDSVLDADEHVKHVPSRDVRDADSLERIEAEFIEQGHEGVIARVPDAPYKFGRSGKTGPLLKIKRFCDFEALVIGVYEEQHNANEKVTNALGRSERSSAKAGKIGKGTLGGLVLRALNGPWEGAEFRCGTGFGAAMRADLWREVREPAGTLNGVPHGRAVAKIKAFDIGSKDKPRHPVFLGWRDIELDG